MLAYGWQLAAYHSAMSAAARSCTSWACCCGREVTDHSSNAEENELERAAEEHRPSISKLELFDVFSRGTHVPLLNVFLVHA